MSGKTWTVVRFVEDDTVETVPSGWIQGDVCHWPPLHRNGLTAAIKISESVNLTWPTRTIHIFKHGVFGTYGKAREKARIAEDTSDLQSEVETIRRRKRTRRFVSSASEESDSDSLIFPSPPPMPEGRKETYPNGSGKCQCCTEQLDTLIKQSHLIRGLLMELSADMKQLKLTQKVVSVAEKPQSLYARCEGLQFLLTREEDLLRLETFLEKEEYFQDAVRELSKAGGDNNYQFVKRVLSSIVDNELALQYSWLGRKGKKVFCTLRLARLVISAAEMTNLAANKRAMEISMQNWLRRAFDRKHAIPKQF